MTRNPGERFQSRAEFVEALTAKPRLWTGSVATQRLIFAVTMAMLVLVVGFLIEIWIRTQDVVSH